MKNPPLMTERGYLQTDYGQEVFQRSQAHLDDWYKDIAPSPHLREWFNHEADKFKEFSIHYKEELKGNDFVQKIKQLLKKDNVTLLYAAKDSKINHAVVLKDYILNTKNI